VYLQRIDVERGLEILKGLQDSAAKVREPNGYVIAAASRAMHEPLETRRQRTEAMHELDTKIRRRIGWLNCNRQFLQPLMYNKVVADLKPLGIPRAMLILKEVEEHEQHPDPSAWLIERARELRFASPGPAEVAEKLTKRLAWLIKNVTFSNELEVAQVMPTLLELDIGQSMHLLKRLEENAASVGDPNLYVLSEASKEARGTEASDSGEAWEASDSGEAWGTDSNVFNPLDSGGLLGSDPVLGSSEEAWEAYEDPNLSPEDALWYNVERLNGSQLLSRPLSYEQISPSLLAIDRHEASRILKLLENDPYVEDPNAFVITEAQARLASV